MLVFVSFLSSLSFGTRTQVKVVCPLSSEVVKEMDTLQHLTMKLLEVCGLMVQAFSTGFSVEPAVYMFLATKGSFE